MGFPKRDAPARVGDARPGRPGCRGQDTSDQGGPFLRRPESNRLVLAAPRIGEINVLKPILVEEAARSKPCLHRAEVDGDAALPEGWRVLEHHLV